MNQRSTRAPPASAGVSAGLLFTLGLVTIAPLCYGPQLADFLDATLGQAQRQHLGLPVAICFFLLASFVGAPQPMLVGASVLAFGPERGFCYALIATVCAGAANFHAGRIWRAEVRKHLHGPRCRRLMRLIGANAFFSSFLVRSVPTAPFVVVNMAFGVARADFWAFIAGMALGSIPKTAIVAFGLNVLLDARDGDVGLGALACLACIGLCALGMLVVRRWARRGDAEDAVTQSRAAPADARAG